MKYTARARRSPEGSWAESNQLALRASCHVLHKTRAIIYVKIEPCLYRKVLSV